MIQGNWMKPFKWVSLWSMRRLIERLMDADEHILAIANGELFREGRRWFQDAAVALTNRRLIILEQQGLFITSAGTTIVRCSRSQVNIECKDPGGFRRTLDVHIPDSGERMSVSFAPLWWWEWRELCAQAAVSA